MDNELKYERAAIEAAEEVKRARNKFPAFRSGHEGFGVIKEEFDELWDEIKMKFPDKIKMRAEAMQVAAMAIAFMVDICEKDEMKNM